MEEAGLEKNKAPRDPHRRHEILWRIFWAPVRLIAWLKFGFVPVKARVKGPFLLVSNHNTNWDPLLVGCSFFREQMYFVASEHIFRSPLAGKLIAWAQDPIPRQKGGSAAATVKAMLRHLKEGHNVAVFPEGNRSWDGVTNPFPPAIGKLAARSGVSLVTYRLTGGYFASPRWSGNSTRRGRMRGRVIHVYSPEELAALTPEEINDRIRQDISEDAYADARKAPVRYTGRRLAEHAETLLCLCPRCRRVGTLQTREDQIRCGRCGLTARYLPTGFLEGEDLPFDNLRDWNRWQQEEIRKLCDEPSEKPVFSDDQVYTDQVISARSAKRIGKGEMILRRDALELPGITLGIQEITGMSVMGAQSLYIGAGERSYLVRSSYPRCMVKYITAVSHLQGDTGLGV